MLPLTVKDVARISLTFFINNLLLKSVQRLFSI